MTKSGLVAVHEDGTVIPLDENQSFIPDRAGRWGLKVHLPDGGETANLNYAVARIRLDTWNDPDRWEW